jgi:protein phosphatase
MMDNKPKPLKDNLQIQATGATDPGRIREQNEDSYFLSINQGLFLVSDGMGGQQAGELASGIVAKALPLQLGAIFALSPESDEKKAETALRQAIANLNDLLRNKTLGDQALQGTGATLALCLVINNLALLSHLGDSRIYLFRKGMLERLTEDHTVAGLMLQLGQITPCEARRHPARNILTRHLGMENLPEIEIARLDLLPGDRILICTDGLTSMASDREIARILAGVRNLKSACNRLIAAANKAGGKDNITVVIVEVLREGKEPIRKSKRIRVRRKVGYSLNPALPTEDKNEQEREHEDGDD